MFEMMNTGFESPNVKALTHKYTFEVPQFPTSTFVQGIGSTESGDLVITANGNATAAIYRKDGSGVFKHYQNAANSGRIDGYAVPMPGGFVVTTPQWPNGRGAMATWELQPGGSYILTATPRDTGFSQGQLGAYGGLASIGDWLFSGINFDGSTLLTFNKAGGVWGIKNYVTKPGSTYFASYCIRELSPTEIVASSSYEQVGAKANAGAVYVLNVTPSGSVEKQRIVPLVSSTSGTFGLSIVVINQNRLVITGKNDTGGSALYTFDRPSASEPFVQTSMTVIAATNIVTSNTFAHYKGMIFGNFQAYNGSVGELHVFSINAAGVITALPELNVKGTTTGQFFGGTQTLIGDELFCVSSYRTDTAKYSSVSVFGIQA